MININKLINKIKFYIKFKKCPLCKHYTPRSSNYCYWCGHKKNKNFILLNSDRSKVYVGTNRTL